MITSDFTQYTRPVCSNMGETCHSVQNDTMSITDTRVHNGDHTGEATFYGIMATLQPVSCRGVIYQIVESDMCMEYNDTQKSVFTEKEKYMEAWVIYSRKPVVYDYIMNERYITGDDIYNKGYRNCILTTWYMKHHNSINLTEMGFYKGNKTGANGLYEHVDTDVITPPMSATVREIKFNWDFTDIVHGFDDIVISVK
jgi:hypothetical protein